MGRTHGYIRLLCPLNWDRCDVFRLVDSSEVEKTVLSNALVSFLNERVCLRIRLRGFIDACSLILFLLLGWLINRLALIQRKREQFSSSTWNSNEPFLCSVTGEDANYGRSAFNLPNKRPRLIKIGLSSLTLGTSSVSTVWYNCRLENDEENDGGSGGRLRRLRVNEDDRRGTVSKCRDTSIADSACPPLICNRILLCWTTNCTMSPHWSCNIRTSSYVESIREFPLNSRIWSPTSMFPWTSAGPPERIFVTKQPE